MFNQIQSVKQNTLFKKRIVAFIVKSHQDAKTFTQKSTLNRSVNDFAVAVFNSKNFIDNMINVYKYSPNRKTFELFLADYKLALSDLKNCIDMQNAVLCDSQADFEPVIRLAKTKTNKLKKYIRTLSKGRVRL